MKIELASGPIVNQVTGTKPIDPAIKARVMAKIQSGGQNQSQEHPVSNPSSVSVEELSAINTNNGQIDQVEAPKVEEPVAASEKPLSSHYANLAREQRALRSKALKQEQAMQIREAKIAEQEAAMKARELDYQSNYIPKEKLTGDTLNALLDAGLSYDQITEAMLQQQSQPDFTKSRAYVELQNELKQIKQSQEQAKKSYEDQQSQAYTQAVNQIKSEAKKLVFTDANFETIKATNSVNDVVELIEETFKQDGILLSVEEAAQAVEDHLVEEAMKIAKIKKIQLKMQSSSPTEKKSTDAPKQQQLKTLTNSVSSTRQLTAKERAMLAFKGEKR